MKPKWFTAYQPFTNLWKRLNENASAVQAVVAMFALLFSVAAVMVSWWTIRQTRENLKLTQASLEATRTGLEQSASKDAFDAGQKWIDLANDRVSAQILREQHERDEARTQRSVDISSEQAKAVEASLEESRRSGRLQRVAEYLRLRSEDRASMPKVELYGEFDSKTGKPKWVLRNLGRGDALDVMLGNELTNYSIEPIGAGRSTDPLPEIFFDKRPGKKTSLLYSSKLGTTFRHDILVNLDGSYVQTLPSIASPYDYLISDIPQMTLGVSHGGQNPTIVGIGDPNKTNAK